jgi:hypothetical protein
VGRVGFGYPFDDPSGIYFEDPESGVVRRFVFRHGRGHALMRSRAVPSEGYESLVGMRRVDPWTGEPSGPVITDSDLDQLEVGEEV